jgi:hypothetical protein
LKTTSPPAQSILWMAAGRWCSLKERKPQCLDKARQPWNS